jgi:hypothetical protein
MILRILKRAINAAPDWVLVVFVMACAALCYISVGLLIVLDGMG